MLRKHVFSTVVYYDCLDFCPTAFEVWKHLLVLEDDGAKPVSLSAVTNALRDLVTERRVVVLRGMYLLPGREEFVPMRIREEKISVGKLKRAQRLIRMLQWVPFVRMIGIAGSLAMKKSEPKSDWDFFVILRSGHIWLGRTFLTGILQLLGKRRHGQYVENRACLNYYLTEEALEISGKDAFAAHEYRFIVPIFDRDVFRRFELANRWMIRFKPNFLPTEIDTRWKIMTSPLSRRTQDFLEDLFDWPWIERWLALWQGKKISRNPKTHLPGSFIEASDQALVFLPRPKGPQIFERYKMRLSETHFPV